MPMIPRKMNIQRVGFTAGTMKTQALPMSVFSGLDLGLYMTATNDAAPTVTIDQLCQVISKIDLVLDGSDTQISIPFEMLYHLNKLENIVDPMYYIFPTASTLGTSYVHLHLPFELIRAINPKDTLLDTRKLSSAVIQVHFKSGTTMGDATISSGYLTIAPSEYAGVDAAAVFGRHEFGYSVADLNKTGKIEINLEVKGRNQYRRLWLFVYATGAALSDTQIDNVKVRTRTFDLLNISGDQLKATNRRNFNQTANTTGLYIVDFPTHGMMSERVDATGLDELVLELNSLVTNGTVTVVKEKVIGR